MPDNHRDTYSHPPSRAAAPIGHVVALGAMWGGGIFLAAIALDHGVSPLLFAPAEAAAICCAGSALHLRYGSTRLFAAGARRSSAITGLTLVVIPYLATYIALGHIGPALAATTQTLTALLTAVLAVSVGAVMLSGRQWCGVLVGLGGVVAVALLAHHGASGAHGASPLWVAIACLAPLSYAVTNVYVSQSRVVRQAAVSAAASSNGVAAVILVVVYLGYVVISHPGWPRLSVLGCVFGVAAICCNLAASLTYFRIASRRRAVDAGIASYVMTIVGVLLSWAFARSTISLAELAAIVVTVGGVVLTRRRGRG